MPVIDADLWLKKCKDFFVKIMDKQVFNTKTDAAAIPRIAACV